MSSGLGQVSRIGLGTWQFGSREWGYGDSYASGAARDIVERALELGVTLFDTAEVYGFGKSERILGEALGEARSEVVVASKLFPLAPFPPVIRQRAQASAQAARPGPHPAVPGASAESGRARLGDHAGNAEPARERQHRRCRRLELLAEALAQSRRRAGPAGRQQPGALLAGPSRPAARSGSVRRAGEPDGDRLQPARAGPARRQVRRRQPPGGVRAINPLFGKENLQPRAAAAGHAAPGRGGARRQARAGRARLAARPAGRRRHPRRVQRRATRVQRRGRRSRTRPGAAVAELTAAAEAFTPLSTARTLVSEVRDRIGR